MSYPNIEGFVFNICNLDMKLGSFNHSAVLGFAASFIMIWVAIESKPLPPLPPALELEPEKRREESSVNRDG